MHTESGTDDPRNSDVVAVIPSRMASTRFPGKPLADATGKPMVQHVYERALAAESIDRVLVATSDEAIIDAVRAFGGEAVLTAADHPNGTSRIAEVITNLPCAIVVSVQGDEPMIDPEAIDLVVDALKRDPDVPMATVACPFTADEAPDDPNLVKVVYDGDRRAKERACRRPRSEGIPRAGSVEAGDEEVTPLRALGARVETLARANVPVPGRISPRPKHF